MPGTLSSACTVTLREQPSAVTVALRERLQTWFCAYDAPETPDTVVNHESRPTSQQLSQTQFWLEKGHWTAAEAQCQSWAYNKPSGKHACSFVRKCADFRPLGGQRHHEHKRDRIRISDGRTVKENLYPGVVVPSFAKRYHNDKQRSSREIFIRFNERLTGSIQATLAHSIQEHSSVYEGQFQGTFKCPSRAPQDCVHNFCRQILTSGPRILSSRYLVDQSAIPRQQRRGKRDPVAKTRAKRLQTCNDV
ncbi:hypothetical protein BKA80DRAFT_251003 [Phyllosticta citrichinensis]